MRPPRHILPLLLAAVLVALSAAAVALAAKPGNWYDAAHKVELGVSDSGKRITYFRWRCKDTRYIAQGFKGRKRPKIRRRGRFSYDGPALVFRNGGPAGQVTLWVKGRFRRVKGKRRAVGRIRADGCTESRFRTKPGSAPGKG